MPSAGVWVSPEGTKTFIPLENNPEIFTSLAHALGLSTSLTFTDVYSLDLLDLVPRPCHALIFIIPPAAHAAVRDANGHAHDVPTESITYDKAGQDEPAMWFHQTIGNACGLIALLHAATAVRERIEAGSVLDRLLRQVEGMKPRERAHALYDSQELEEMHMKAAKSGESKAPRAEDFVALHFMALVKGKDGHLWELEGSTDGPLDRGVLREESDMLSEDALEKGVKEFIRRGGGDVQFSIIALSG